MTSFFALRFAVDREHDGVLGNGGMDPARSALIVRMRAARLTDPG
jgi:hypothetical protein